MVGIDIGSHSTKVIQLRYEASQAILETYGELLNERTPSPAREGENLDPAKLPEKATSKLLKDVLRESKVTTTDAALSIPVSSSFVTTVSFPQISRREIAQSIQFEARKYIPIPISEVLVDWDIFDPEPEQNNIDVLLVAVPKEIFEKLRRIAKMANIAPRTLEIETFSMMRALSTHDLSPTALINIGHLTTTLAIIDRGRLYVSHNIGHGSNELTRALERGLQINRDRAESIKREVGLSERLEEKEIVSIMLPLVESLFTEIQRLINRHDRRHSRKVQKINLTGGGANLPGIVEHTVSSFGMEVTKGDPFSRIVTPAFIQPVLREIGPTFSVATGLALREVMNS